MTTLVIRSPEAAHGTHSSNETSQLINARFLSWVCNVQREMPLFACVYHYTRPHLLHVHYELVPDSFSQLVFELRVSAHLCLCRPIQDPRMTATYVYIACSAEQQHRIRVQLRPSYTLFVKPF
jgi:hypothetical protein